MSADFSIKPVGAPVATPIVQPIREAAKQAVKTELPPTSTVSAADAGVAVRYDANVVSRSMSNQILSNQVTIDRDAASIVYQVVDTRTSQVIKQFPEEAVLRRRAYFRSLELTKEAPTRLRETDRKA
jgi:FlaG protein